MANNMLLMVSTRKGAWLYHGDAARKTWRTDGPHFLGHIIHHINLGSVQALLFTPSTLKRE